MDNKQLFDANEKDADIVCVVKLIYYIAVNYFVLKVQYSNI